MPKEVRVVSLSLLLCRQCSVLHPLPAGPTADDDLIHDLAAFRAAHEAHGLADAQRLPDAALFDGPTWDPMSTRWFRVIAGPDILLVRSWRSSIEEPRRFEVTAVPPPTADCIDVDEALLRRALDRHFYPHAIRPTKVERVVRTVHELIAPLDPRFVETTFDDASLPNASIGPFPPALCDALLARCTAFLDAWEAERLRTFIAEHHLEDGALAVRVRRILNRSAA
jgi:hypothetical protein